MSYYQNRFVPKVRSFTIEDEGEEMTFYLRKPKAVDMIRRGSEMRKREKEDEEKRKANPAYEPAADSEAVNREMIGIYVVNEDGTPISSEDIDGILAFESTAFAKFSEGLTEMIGGKKAAAAGEEPKNV